MFILKILFAPLSLILSLFVWLCAGLLHSLSYFVQKHGSPPFPVREYSLTNKKHLCLSVLL